MSRLRNGAGLPFSIASRLSNGQWREEARFVCARCDAHASFPVVRPRGSGFSPEHIIRKATGAGWKAEFRSERAECPRCTGAKNGACLPSIETKSTEVIAMKPPTKAQPAAALPIAPIAPIAPLPGPQRMKIRTLLDKHFDDAAGRYLDGYSDQRVATEVDVPRIHVEKAREAAYGPIRAFPEVEAAEKALAAMEARWRQVMDQIEAHRKEADAALKAVESARAVLRAA